MCATASPWSMRLTAQSQNTPSKNVIIPAVDRSSAFSHSLTFAFRSTLVSRCALLRFGPTATVGVAITTAFSVACTDEEERHVLHPTFTTPWTNGSRRLDSTPSWLLDNSKGARSPQNRKIVLNIAPSRRHSSILSAKIVYLQRSSPGQSMAPIRIRRQLLSLRRTMSRDWSGTAKSRSRFKAGHRKSSLLQ